MFLFILLIELYVRAATGRVSLFWSKSLIMGDDLAFLESALLCSPHDITRLRYPLRFKDRLLKLLMRHILILLHLDRSDETTSILCPLFNFRAARTNLRATRAIITALA
ncbi:hypothetical protein BKA63DRAFT_298398 [Paraphoma chrysanthemicola]|nr:hypothetical protein BKA63DRAFT_298398 [Paraphoma chrysanthemicola]